MRMTIQKFPAVVLQLSQLVVESKVNSTQGGNGGSEFSTYQTLPRNAQPAKRYKNNLDTSLARSLLSWRTFPASNSRQLEMPARNSTGVPGRESQQVVQYLR